jgi:glycosyltransferase involved in cell wall biosynthesis
VQLVETRERVALFHQHYLDAPLEYLAAIRLLKYAPRDADARVFFGPPSLPALWWAKTREKRGCRALYFCYEPPRFIYADTPEIVARLGVIGIFARPVFALYKTLDRAMVRKADVLLSNSPFAANLLRAAYSRDARVITHGADFGEPDRERVLSLSKKYQTHGRRVLITVNFLHPRKRVDLFLRALAGVRASVPNTVGLVVGAGPELERLRKIADQLHLRDAVRFTGFVADEDLPAHYALADVYVHTGKLESFGLSVLEASALGVPVVSVNEGGPREILADGETGFLADATPGALAAKIVALLQDDARRAALGRAAREHARQDYAWERGAEDFLHALG